ncbi:hypothetical protein [uncultured Aquimarina sp.]|uniref:hypothetical protein n=1 Tax=uncultured Aquimarina sp. TaxID=575652 RepID=UPI0026289944|nr:hypothetical protein [uncultured Aquimarina sp.]
MKKTISILMILIASLQIKAQDTINGDLIVNNGSIKMNSANPTDPYSSISFRHQDQVKWLMDYGTGTTDDFRILKFNSPTSASSFLSLDYNNNQFEILNSNVGIGTTNPIEKLHVEGSFLLDSYQAGDQNGLFFREGFSSSNKYNLSILTHNDGDNSPDALDINAYDGIYFNTGSNSRNPRMTIKGGGNVGIGTTNPTQKLQVDALDSAIQIQLNRTGSNTGKADFGVDNTGLHYWVGGYDGFGKEEFFIGTNGNVGIGTTNPDTKLAVNGNIHTKEVKVDLVGWPDYVFENDYNLPTLQEVENHIAEKGHLENIPSATEVAENGIQLGEMNVKLLQKIEELTLYMIEQNKKTDTLIKEVEILKQKNAELEKKMK